MRSSASRMSPTQPTWIVRGGTGAGGAGRNWVNVAMLTVFAQVKDTTAASAVA